jgi:hypothetical protein
MARLRVGIVFESGARIGPGKVKLLESIRDTGSISAAAREMGMSYNISNNLGCRLPEDGPNTAKMSMSGPAGKDHGARFLFGWVRLNALFSVGVSPDRLADIYKTHVRPAATVGK